MDDSVVFVVMAKAPRPGEVKTRLCPPLAAEEAAALARAFLLDRVAQVTAAGADRVIAFTPEADHAVFEALVPGVPLVPQRGDDLGARMRHAVEDMLRAGRAAVIVVGTDTPTLPTEVLRRAADLVRRPDVDAVLGPSDDGGYYLIGMRRVWAFLFDDVAWSTAAVRAETLRRADAHGLRVACLPPWFDVDTPADLERLRVSLAATPGPAASHTRAFLDARWP